jgi:outer membrane lipoprotein SlyB
MMKETWMLYRVLKALRVWMLVPLAITAADNVAWAEPPTRIEYGKIEAIEIYRGSDKKPVSVGTVLGGVAGGVIGHQIGSGRGNTAATIVGAIGGAVIGNEIEKKHVQGSRYRITVRLDSGSALIVEDARDVDLRVGDRVRVENNRIDRV